MKGLLEAPDDVKLKIFEVSDPRDVRACQLVCRALHDLIASSPQMQYMVALGALGYAMPSVPRLDLTPHQKIEFLKRHHRSWSSLDTSQLTEHMFPLHERGIYEFNGGFSALVLISDEDPLFRYQRLKGIHFYQPLSPNLGLEFSREWCIPDFGLFAQGLVFDTTQDLLVLVELIDPSHSWSEGCRIYLRTMSDNSQHPRAVLPFLLAEFTESEGDLGSDLVAPIAFDIIKVVGNSLAILFRSRTQHTASWVVVWDWNRGEELTRISPDSRDGTCNSFTLLSQNKLLLPRHSKSHYVHKDLPDDTCGSLDIYIFDLDVTTSTPPRMIASFDLPKLSVRPCVSVVQIAGGPSPNAPSTCRDTRPKVYQPAVQDRLIAVTVWLTSTLGPGKTYPQLLYVPESLLLRLQRPSQILGGTQGISDVNDEVTKVAWDTWAPFISWREGDGASTHGNYLYAQRTVMLSNLPNTAWNLDWGRAPPEVIIFGFNQRRVRLAKSSHEHATHEPPIMAETAMSVRPSRGGRGVSGRGGTRATGFRGSRGTPRPVVAYLGIQDRLKKLFCNAQVECIRRAWRLPDRPGFVHYPIITMDDEHVTVLKLEQGGPGEGRRPGLLVYTFG